MKTKVFCLLLLCFLSFVELYPQNSFENFLKIRQALDSIIVHDTITVGSLYGSALEEIVLDYKQTNQALINDNNSLKEEKEKLIAQLQVYKNNQKLYFFFIIGLSLISLVFIILFVIKIIHAGKLKQRISEITKDTTNYISEIEQLKSKIDILNNELLSEKDKNKVEIEKIKSEHSNVLSSYISENNNLKAQVIQLQESINKYINTEANLQNTINILKAEIESYKNQLSDLKTKADESESQKNKEEQYIKKITEYENIINNLKKEISEKNVQSQSFDYSEYKKLIEENDQLKKEIERKSSERYIIESDIYRKLQEENYYLKKQLEELERHKDKGTRDTEAQFKILSEEVERLKKDKEYLDQKLIETNRELIQIKTDYNWLKKDFNDLQEKYNRIRSDYAELEKEHQIIKESKKRVDEELVKFIEELQKMLPLPKR